MRKYLVLCFLLVCSVVYGATDKRLDSAIYQSIASTNVSVRSGNINFVVTSSGDMYVRVPGTANSYSWIRTSTDRSTWEYKNDSTTGASRDIYMWLLAEGDSVYVISGGTNTAANDGHVALFKNGDMAIYDTLFAGTDTGCGSGNRIGAMLNPNGASLYVVYQQEATADTSLMVRTDGALDQGEIFALLNKMNVTPYAMAGSVDAFRIDSSLLFYDPVNDWLHAWDSANGYRRVSTNLLSNPTPNDTGGTACIACGIMNHRTFWIRGDTFGMLYQIRRSRTILLERFRLTNATTVTSLGTTRVTDGADSSTIVEAGNWFLRSQPSWVAYGPHSGDTAAVIYRDWPDTTDKTRPRVRRSLTFDGGATFQAATTLKDSITDGGGSPRAYHQLVAPDAVPRNWPTAGDFLTPFGYVDSVTSGSTVDSFWIHVPDAYSFSSGGSPTSTGIIRGGVIRGGVLRNRPEVIWREE